MDSVDIDVLKRKWIEEQNIQRQSLILEDPLWLRGQITSERLLVGGLDISFSKIDSKWAVAALAVVEMKSLKLVCTVSQPVQLTIPYIPTFLAYREVDPFERLYAYVTQHCVNRVPHILLVDGNGTLHPRGFGCACLLGCRLNCSTIGVAKSLLDTESDELNYDFSVLQFKQSLANKRRETREHLTHRGDQLSIRDAKGAVCGAALLNTDNSINPVYVSPGHLISLDTACEIVLKMSKFRTPEPIRLADQISRQKVRLLDAEHCEHGEGFSMSSSFEVWECEDTSGVGD